MRLNKNIILFIYILSHITVFAADEKARALVHWLSYIEGDYVNAVKDGKVLSDIEYGEMSEFGESIANAYPDFAASIAAIDTANYGNKIRTLHQYIQNKVSPDSVSPLAGEIKKAFIKIGNLTTAPLSYPDVSKGAIVYVKECSRCHGDKGLGDGKDGIGATPLPRNFHDNERMSELSPFAVFNTVRLGIDGTLMKPHPTLSDKEVWDVAFYVLSLRYNDLKPDKAGGKKVTLADVASKSDEELEDEFKLSEAEIADIRLQKPTEAHHTFLKVASDLLTKALTAYKDADYKKAHALAASAYLEGVEAVEMPLKNANPKLAEKLEQKMMYVRTIIKKEATVEEVEKAIEEAQLVIIEASVELESKEYSFAMAFWMTLAILLREGLEAFLVIMAILAVLNKADLRHQKKYVHAAWIGALLIGFIMWFLSGKLFQMGFGNIEILEGVISLTAVIMLLYIGFWLHGKSHAEQWKKYVSGLVKSATGNGSELGLISITFFVVFREVFESVLFLSALNIESKGTQTAALGTGFLVAFAAVVVLAIITLKFSAKLPIQKLFRLSAIMMSVLAVILTGKGIKAFQETSLISAHNLQLPTIELLGFFPTIESIAAQILIALTVAVLWRYSNKKQ